jgi:hypothetical protein
MAWKMIQKWVLLWWTSKDVTTEWFLRDRDGDDDGDEGNDNNDDQGLIQSDRKVRFHISWLIGMWSKSVYKQTWYASYTQSNPFNNITENKVLHVHGNSVEKHHFCGGGWGKTPL